MTEDAGRTIVFLTETLGTKEGGKSEGMFKAAKMLRDGGHRVVIANHVFGKNQKKKFHELLSRVGADDIAFENLYNWLAGEETTDELEKEPKVRNQNKNKHLTYTKEYHKAGSSTCCRREHYDIDDGQIAMSLHRPSSGEAYMTATSWDDNNPATGIEDLICGRHFNKLNDLLSRFLTYLDGKYHSPVFITDHILWDRVLCSNHGLTYDPKTIALFTTSVFDESRALRKRCVYLSDKTEIFDIMLFLDQDNANTFAEKSNIKCDSDLIPDEKDGWNSLIANILEKRPSEISAERGEIGSDGSYPDAKSIIMITDTFSISAGGRTASLFRRAKLYTEMGYKVFIATKNFRIHYRAIFNTLCEKYSLEGVELLNPYLFFAEENIYTIDSPEAAKMTNGDVDESDPKQRITKDIEGHIVREQRYEINASGKKNMVYESFSTPVDKRVYFLKNEESGEYEWIRRDGTKKVFRNIRKALEYWMSQMCAKAGDPIIIAEQHRNVDMLINNPFMDDRQKTIAIIHSTFFDSPYTYASKPNEYYDKPLKRIEEYAKVVSLTEQESEHIANIYGHSNRIVKIPHPIEQIETVDVERDPNLIVICSRLDPVKRIDQSILAMAKVVKECPEAKFHIYGDGSERESLGKLIVENGLEENVKLMGYTSEPIKCISGSLFTVSTSKYEGLPLQIQEALMTGTPVIAYDYMYGPKELIRDGENGFIVKRDDIEGLAEKMIWMFRNPDQVEKMSGEARIQREDHSKDAIREKWKTVFAEVSDWKNSGTVLPPHTVKVKRIKRKNRGDNKQLYILIDIHFEQDVNEQIEFTLNYNSGEGIQFDDKLYRKGLVQWRDKRNALVEFNVAYPRNWFDTLLPDKRKLKLEIETPLHSYRYAL